MYSVKSVDDYNEVDTIDYWLFKYFCKYI
jgi:hypothetical protein